MNRRIIVLDDDPFRHALFEAAIPEFEIISVYDVAGFGDAIRESKTPDLISLDHDLVADECGCHAAGLVCSHVSVNVPVLVHSNNEVGAQVMRRILVTGDRCGRVGRFNMGFVESKKKLLFRYTGQMDIVLSEAERIAALRQSVYDLLLGSLWTPGLSPAEILRLLDDDDSVTCSSWDDSGRS